MKDYEQFWMLFVEGGNSPAHKHLSQVEAEKEAERLAKVTGKMVHVLESIASCQVNNFTWKGNSIIGIPF